MQFESSRGSKFLFKLDELSKYRSLSFIGWILKNGTQGGALYSVKYCTDYVSIKGTRYFCQIIIYLGLITWYFSALQVGWLTCRADFRLGITWEKNIFLRRADRS